MTYPTISIKQAVENIRSGHMIAVIDDRNRENQADIVFPAQTVTEERVNFLIRECRGMVCVPLTRNHGRRLQLPLMVDPMNNTETTGVNFTVTVDAKSVSDFGISVRDRTKTILALADPATTADDFVRPGHIFPLLALPGGLTKRQGHTEATVTLCQLAGFSPCGVLCEILDESGYVAIGERLIAFAKRHRIGMVTIPDLAAYSINHPLSALAPVSLVVQTARATLPTPYGTFAIITYRSVSDGREHAVLLKDIPGDGPILTRIHSQCLTGDALCSLRCDCGEQLRMSMELIGAARAGIIVYLNQEGRGIGLTNKIKAYALQERGMDTVKANHALGFPADARDFQIAADILHDIGINDVHLLTNNPEKERQLMAYGIRITRTIPLETSPNEINRTYLQTKKQRLGHRLAHV